MDAPKEYYEEALPSAERIERGLAGWFGEE